MNKTARLWTDGEKPWFIGLVGLYLMWDSVSKIWADQSITNVILVLFSIGVLFYVYSKFKKSYDREAEVNRALEEMGQKAEVEDIATINATKKTGFLGVFIGKNHYPMESEDGSYTVERYAITEDVTFFHYRYKEEVKNFLLVRDTKQKVDEGGIRVYVS
jgi:hypothetical protein